MAVEYNEEKMKRFVEKDLLLKRMYTDLKENDNVLETLFYSEVYGDSGMEQAYEEA